MELILKDGEPSPSHSPNWTDNLTRWPTELKQHILKWHGMAVLNGTVPASYCYVFMTFKAMDMGLKTFSQDTALARLTGTPSLSMQKPEPGEHFCSSYFIQAVIFFCVIQFYYEKRWFSPQKLKISSRNWKISPRNWNVKCKGTWDWLNLGGQQPWCLYKDCAYSCGCCTGTLRNACYPRYWREEKPLGSLSTPC